MKLRMKYEGCKALHRQHVQVENRATFRNCSTYLIYFEVKRPKTILFRLHYMTIYNNRYLALSKSIAPRTSPSISSAKSGTVVGTSYPLAWSLPISSPASIFSQSLPRRSDMPVAMSVLFKPRSISHVSIFSRKINDHPFCHSRLYDISITF
jgi:hypothetical protein